MCLVVEIDQFSYMLLTKRKQKPAILQAWTTKQNGLNKMWPNVFAKCEITRNVLLWIHRVSTIVASVSKTWMLFQIQNFFMPRSRHDHFPRLSRFETEMRHWHSKTETLKNVSRDRDTSRDIQLCSAVALLKSLKPILQQIRNNFAQYESIGKALSGTSLYTSEKRNQRDQVRDWIDSRRLELRDTFRAQTFYAIIDKLSAELY